MPERYVALLRSINVGGRNRVPMADLRAMICSMGFSDVTTLLQSGNVVFAGTERAESEVEAELEAALAERMGVTTTFFVRRSRHLAAVVKNNPFPGEAVTDPSHLVVLFTKQPAAPERVDILQAAIKGRETVRQAGDHVYAFYPDGIGESKLTIAVIEKALGTSGTARNWNTVVKLFEMASGA